MIWIGITGSQAEVQRVGAAHVGRGPQVVTRHGEEVVVVVPVEEFRRMSYDGEKKMDFKEILMSAPEGLEHIIPERPRDDFPRDVDLTDGP
jgi:antitoxin Phd